MVNRGFVTTNVLVQRLCARLFLAQWQWLLCWLPAILPVMATLLDFMLSKMAAGGSFIFTRQTWECFRSSPLSVCKKANKTISPTIKLFLQKLNYGEPRSQQTASVAISIFSHYKLLLRPHQIRLWQQNSRVHLSECIVLLVTFSFVTNTTCNVLLLKLHSHTLKWC